MTYRVGVRYQSRARDALEVAKTKASSSLTDLAKLLDSDQPAMGRILRGERRPGRGLSMRIQSTLGIPASWWDEPPADAAGKPTASTGTGG
jgi:hypothetical protein